MPQSRTADVLHSLSPVLLLYLILVILISALLIHTPLQAAPSQHTPPRGLLLQTAPPTTTPATTPPSTPAYPTAEQLKAQDERFVSALDVLKDRASSQQTLIATLTTLTGLYVVILSFAAYFRLQQTRDESREAVARNEKGFEDTKDFYVDRFGDLKDRIADLETNAHTKVTALITEVRTDIPALHGIGRRLEQLLAELDSRLPVDGDWSTAATYDKLPTDAKEQALIDEMVINSLDIFNVTQDIGARRTIARLYVRLGQFYFARASSLKATFAAEKKAGTPATVHPDDPPNSLCRASLYLDKAVRVDEKDPVALRARGVILIHYAVWKGEAAGSVDYDKTILAHSRSFIDRSLNNDPTETGALLARAWLLIRATPPEYEAAIKDLTTVIDRADKLPTLHRKKFLANCYLNRANYTARILRQGTPTPEQKKLALESIPKDIQAGMNEAKCADKENGYKTDLKKEIATGGDLELIYPEIKSTVDPLLT